MNPIYIQSIDAMVGGFSSGRTILVVINLVILLVTFIPAYWEILDCHLSGVVLTVRCGHLRLGGLI